MKAIYKFESDCGRMGTLYGIFVADSKEVNDLTTSGDEVYFGEVLGKYSEIIGEISATEITMVTAVTELVEKFEELNMETGFNPIAIWKEQKGR